MKATKIDGTQGGRGDKSGLEGIRSHWRSSLPKETLHIVGASWRWLPGLFNMILVLSDMIKVVFNDII